MAACPMCLGRSPIALLALRFSGTMRECFQLAKRRVAGGALCQSSIHAPNTRCVGKEEVAMSIHVAAYAGVARRSYSAAILVRQQLLLGGFDLQLLLAR